MSKTSNLYSIVLLVIMAAILVAGLCLSIVLFEDQLVVASAYADDFTWSDISYSSSNTVSLSGYNLVYFTSSSSALSNCTCLYYNANGTSNTFYIFINSTGMYLSTNSSTGASNYRLYYTSIGGNGFVLYFPYGLNNFTWGDNKSIVLHVSNISTGSGSVDPSQYVTIEQYNTLNSQYQSVSSQLTQLQSDYSSLSSDYVDLESAYDELEIDNINLNSQLSDSQLNLTQKTNQLNGYFARTNELVAIVGGFYYPDDLELIDWLVENGYLEDEDSPFTIEMWFDVLDDINLEVVDLVANKNLYLQVYEDYQELLSAYQTLSDEYDLIIESLEFNSKSMLSIDRVDASPGTTVAVSNGYIAAANTTGQARFRYNLGVTIPAGSEVVINYDFANNIYGYVLYPIKVTDGHNIIIDFRSATDPKTYSYTTAYDLSYLDVYSQNPTSTDTSAFIADIQVLAKTFDVAAVIDSAYKTGQDSIDTQSYYDSGYTEGYDDGYDDANRGGIFLGLMTSVVDAPVQVVNGMFDFTILGINVKEFFYALISICLVIAIVKFCLK